MSKRQFFDQLKNYMHGNEFNKLKSGFVTWLTHGFHIIILVVGMITAFFGGLYYKDVSTVVNVKDKNFTTVHTMAETSISINDRNELMILNRNNSEVIIYTDTIGFLVQKMYTEKREVVAKVPETKTKK